MVLNSHLQPPNPPGFGASSTAEEVTEGLDFSGRTYLLTGCSSGLGKETLRVLALRGARILAFVRTLEKAKSILAQNLWGGDSSRV